MSLFSLTKLGWKLRALAKSIWFPVAAFGLFGVLSPVIAPWVAPLLPRDFVDRFGEGAVERLLDILATSMLGVTTFAVSIMVTSFASAATEATPRTLELLQTDVRTRYVLGIFVGNFVFALAGIIGLEAGVFDDDSRAVLFLFAVLAIGIIVLALMNWIAHLTVFGRMHDSLGRVEQATREALQRRLAEPYMGARRMEGLPPPGAHRIDATRTGYVRHIDVDALQERAEAAGAEVWLLAEPGSFVTAGRPLLAWNGPLPPKDAENGRLEAHFVVGQLRSFEQDPGFGFLVLSEIAQRALSPGVNDPGTAIDVLGRFARLMSEWSATLPGADSAPRCSRVVCAPLDMGEAVRSGIGPILRDGAGQAEVLNRAVDVLAALTGMADDDLARAAREQAADAVTHAEAALTLPREVAALRARVAEMGVAPGSAD